MSELNRAALEQRPEDELVMLVVSRVRAMVDATVVAAWVANRDDGLSVAHAQGDGAAALAGSVADGGSLIATVARSGRSELVTDARADVRVPRALVDAGAGAAIFVPLTAGDETFAVIGVLRASGREPFRPHETDLMQSFGIQAGPALRLRAGLDARSNNSRSCPIANASPAICTTR